MVFLPTIGGSMVVANLSNLGWTSGQPKRNQAVFNQLMSDSLGAFDEGFFIQPPMVKTARTIKFSRSPEIGFVQAPQSLQRPVSVLQPILTLPVGYPSQATRRAVADLAQKLVKEQFRNRQYLLWINSITHFQAQLAERLMPGAESRVFDASDLLMMYERNGGEHSTPGRAILNACEVAICASEHALAQISHPVKYLMADCPETRIHMISNVPLQMPPLFPKPSGAVYIGFFGILTAERRDFDLLHAIFLRFPDFQFVFVGTTNRSSLLSRLKRYPNFHHVPPLTEQAATSVIKQFDVAILPELDNDYTRGTDGARIFDYLSCGVPVLSTAARHLAKFGGAPHVARSGWEFSYQLERILTTGRGT